MKTSAYEILKDIGSQLVYQQSAGIERYPATEAIKALLEAQPAPAGVNLPQQDQRPVAASKQHTEFRPVPDEVNSVQESITDSTLVELSKEIRTCRACALSGERVLAVPGSGSDRVRLLIVGDWLSVERGTRLPATCVFGIEQDHMLGRMLDAINLPRSNVFVTNIIKCGVPAMSQPKADHATTCYSYLKKQIAIVRPELIMVMGMIPARVMLNRSLPLSRLRGRFHSYATTDGRKIPLVATYHPTFLLQNAGMKRATWEDLKLVARQLDLT